MNWARAGVARAERRTTRDATKRPARGPARRSVIGFSSGLPEKDARAPHLLGRDHAQEVRDEPVHELEIGGERGDLLLLAVEDLFRELLLVQVLPGAAVDEVELRRQAEPLALEVAVGAHEARPAGAGIAHHALLGLEAGTVLLLEAHPPGDDERV